MRYLWILAVIVVFASCSKDDDGGSTTDTPAPGQQVVTFDTSATSGELSVITAYFDGANVQAAPTNTVVRLYATYEDLQNDLPIYSLFSNGDITYFGFINIGNYYVTSEATINLVNYYGESVVQVRSRRQETLTVTMNP